MLKVFGRTGGLFGIGFLLVLLSSWLYSIFPTLYLLIVFIIISLFISYEMPLWFKIFWGVKRYKGNCRKEILGFAKKQRIELGEIYVRNKWSGFAKAMGIGNNKSVLFSQVLLDSFSEGEIEAVLAHELGHHYNKGVWIHSLLIPVLLFVSGWFVESSNVYFPTPLLSVLVATLILLFIGLFLNRWREYLADVYAKNNLKKPAEFASFLKRAIKIEEENGNRVAVNPPYKFLYTHPWIYTRIKFFEGK